MSFHGDARTGRGLAASWAWDVRGRLAAPAMVPHGSGSGLVVTPGEVVGEVSDEVAPGTEHRREQGFVAVEDGDLEGPAQGLAGVARHGDRDEEPGDAA